MAQRGSSDSDGLDDLDDFDVDVGVSGRIHIFICESEATREPHQSFVPLNGTNGLAVSWHAVAHWREGTGGREENAKKPVFYIELILRHPSSSSGYLMRFLREG